MTAQQGKPESIARRGCFISGVVAVIVLVVLRRFLFRLPPLAMIVLAGLLWLGFFVVYMRRGYRPPG